MTTPTNNETDLWTHMSKTPPTIIEDDVIIEHCWNNAHWDLFLRLVRSVVLRRLRGDKFMADELSQLIIVRFMEGRRWYSFKDHGDPEAFQKFLRNRTRLFVRDYFRRGLTSQEERECLLSPSPRNGGNDPTTISDDRLGVDPHLLTEIADADGQLIAEFIATLNHASLHAFQFIDNAVLGQHPPDEIGVYPITVLREYLDDLASHASLERGLADWYRQNSDIKLDTARKRLQRLRDDYRKFRKSTLMGPTPDQE